MGLGIKCNFHKLCQLPITVTIYTETELVSVLVGIPIHYGFCRTSLLTSGTGQAMLLMVLLY